MKRSTYKSGFSLTEVVVALGVITVAVVSLVGILPIAHRGVANAAKESEATELTSGVMMDVRLSGDGASTFYGVTLPGTAESKEIIYLKRDGSTAGVAEEAVFRCELSMRVLNDEGSVHVHAMTTWPAVAKAGKEQGAVELVALVNRRE